MEGWFGKGKQESFNSGGGSSESFPDEQTEQAWAKINKASL